MHHSKQPGKVFLIGGGPGDPDLLTVKAARVLAECDVILYDRLTGPEILSLAKPSAELIYVGKHEGEQERVQARIFELILTHALRGKSVARLKGGDPMIFGRGAEEWALALEHGIEVEVVPGLSSALSVPALAGIPLTYRELSQGFAVITGHCRRGLQQNWKAYAQLDTLVILMAVKNRAAIAQALLDAGRSPSHPIAFIERGATARERVIEADLAALAKGLVEVENPAVLVIGEVVRLRQRLMTMGGVLACMTSGEF